MMIGRNPARNKVVIEVMHERRIVNIPASKIFYSISEIVVSVNSVMPQIIKAKPRKVKNKKREIDFKIDLIIVFK